MCKNTSSQLSVFSITGLRYRISRINLVVGNHKSFYGIAHIVEILRRDVLKKTHFDISNFPNERSINLIIEDFHSKQFRNQLRSSRAKNILIVTEFLSKSGNISINDFKPDPFEVFLEMSKQFALRSIPKREFRSEIKKRVLPSGNSYWKQRSRGLEEMLDSNVFRTSMSLHPSTLTNFNDFPLMNVDVLPTVRVAKRKKKLQKVFITLGSMSSYRRTTLTKLNKILPMGVLHLVEEQIVSELPRLEEVCLIDVYIRNRSNWNYTSPIRIARSLNQGREVVLFDNKDMHPIVNTCVNMPSVDSFADIEEQIEDSRESRLEYMNEYNSIARIANTSALSAILEN